MSVAVDYKATEKLNLNLGLTYNHAKENWDWDFSQRPSLVYGGSPQTAYDTWEQNDLIDDYSDLKYEQYEATVGGTYNFTDSCYTSASFTYDKFNSDEEYVYGDEDGEAYFSYIGVGYRF